jgi:cellobiose PTS system EIIC component
MAKLSEQRHLRAIRDGVISSLPFIMIGSLCLMIAFPPVPKDGAFAIWAHENMTHLLLPYRLTMFIMSLYIAFGIGYHLAKSYQLDPLSGGQIAVCALLFTVIPQTVTPFGYVLPMQNLGGHGLFVTILVSILSVEIMRFCKNKHLTIKLPEQVPSSVAHSFAALLPIGFVVGILAVITMVLNIDLHLMIDQAMTPLIQAGNTLPGILIPVFMITFFWSCGIHGVSVVGTVARPMWEVYLAKNAEAVATGTKTIPYVAPETFYQWFIWIGGSGATLGLVLAMLFFSNTSDLKTLGKVCIIPSIFNINEPVLFGLPIVLNPILIIPFIITPIVTATLSYFATVIGWITPTYVMVPWTLPAPIGAYLATGGDPNAIVLVLVNIAISFFLYLPFFKMYERKKGQSEKGEQLAA